MDSIGNAFSDIGGTLFGEKPSVSYAPKSGMQTSIEQLLQQYLKQYQGQMTGATPVPTYTGQMTAGLTPLQTGSIANVGELQNLDESGMVLSKIMDMISGKNFDPSYMRSAYKTGIEDPLRQTFTETTMPALQSSYAKSGLFYGSDRATATQDVASTLMDALSMGRSNLESNIYTAGLANQQAGIEDFSQWLADQGGLARTGMDVGAREQDTEQAKSTNEYNQWLRTQAGTMPTDQLLQAILSMYGTTGDQAIVTPASPGVIGTLATAAMGAGTLGWKPFA